MLSQSGEANGATSDVFEKGVLVLNDDNFDDAISRYENCLLVSFYIPDW